MILMLPLPSPMTQGLSLSERPCCHRVKTAIPSLPLGNHEPLAARIHVYSGFMDQE